MSLRDFQKGEFRSELPEKEIFYGGESINSLKEEYVAGKIEIEEFEESVEILLWEEKYPSPPVPLRGDLFDPYVFQVDQSHEPLLLPKKLKSHGGITMMA